MSTTCIRFRCPHCHVRIKAPQELVGHVRDCPKCRREFLVLGQLEDAGAMLVLVEGSDRFALGLRDRAEPALVPLPRRYASRRSA